VTAACEATSAGAKPESAAISQNQAKSRWLGLVWRRRWECLTMASSSSQWFHSGGGVDLCHGGDCHGGHVLV